ncbi:conjugal transfer protein [Streptomyces anulatus]|uniref:conjugal transfer protein n=1 Tax=Streptomyces anulatus TaxID=1892 RepID=UPI00224EA8D9|nr:conjugal transfer protein [Streptomyces anulatus]MCX4524077.1 conjugal transfer protein [Streptomyces anulatus]
MTITDSAPGHTEDAPTTQAAPETTARRKLTRMQLGLLIGVIVPMVAVGVAGGIGTYSNISGEYGSETAVGALAAGEGATVVLALVLLVTTLLGQSAPRIVRAGLWSLPTTAGVMGATAATGTGETIVYALTPMAITAAAEGIAFLARRVVVYQERRDVEAETRAARIVRDLAYHHSRSTAHPTKIVRWMSARKSWRLAAKVGTGDARLGTDLMTVQRDRITSGADSALAALFGGQALTPSVLTRGTEGTDAPHLTESTELPAGTDSTEGTAPGAEAGDERGKSSPQVSAGDLPASARISAHLQRLDWQPLPGKPAALTQVAPGKPAALTAAAPAVPAPAGQGSGKPGNGAGQGSGRPQVATLAQAVRDVIEEGITDREEIKTEVRSRLPFTPKPDSLRREMNRQLPKMPVASTRQAGPYL